jgi:hypothetical protein
MRDLHHRIMQAVAAGALLVACTSDAGKQGTASAGDTDAAPREKTKAEGRMQPVGVQTHPEQKAGRCGEQTWCGSKAATAKITVTKKPISLGCPAEIAGAELMDHVDEPDYVGLSAAVTAKVDEAATMRKRGEGDENTCCYTYDLPCRGI